MISSERLHAKLNLGPACSGAIFVVQKFLFALVLLPFCCRYLVEGNAARTAMYQLRTTENSLEKKRRKVDHKIIRLQRFIYG